VTEPPPRLRWQCRRGLLELDALLQAFLDGDWTGLSPPEREAFEALLGYPDATLLQCLMGHMMPLDLVTARVVRRIRQGAAH
jgi:antitoxin CptB